MKWNNQTSVINREENRLKALWDKNHAAIRQIHNMAAQQDISQKVLSVNISANDYSELLTLANRAITRELKIGQ